MLYVQERNVIIMLCSLIFVHVGACDRVYDD